ncbi:MAG: radical SAM/SPASM domain-containing protein [Bacteroidota bacterium]|nr:radical SAM/SPASM domain-containing protein [Bacteroidota bacterium]
MTFRRILNFFRILLSYYYSRIIKKPVQGGLPFSISFEPSNLCNLSCPECPTGKNILKREKGIASLSTARTVLDQVSSQAFYLNLSFQGEPFLNPDVIKMIRMAKQRKMFVTISTNGHFLDPETCFQIVESGLDSILISVDGTTQEVYEKYRIGGSLAKVSEGVRNLVDAKINAKKRHPRITLQFLVFRHNEHQIKEIRQMARLWGADTVKLKTAQIYNFETGSSRMTTIQRFSRYIAIPEKNADKNTGQEKYRIKYHLSNHCFRLWSTCVITWDGRVVPCCFDKNADFEMGNICYEIFKDIWFGEKFNHFRENILNNRKGVFICRNCVK